MNLPRKIVETIVKEVPGQVFILAATFHHNKDCFSPYMEPQDHVMMLGTFTAIEMANESGRAFVKERLEGMTHNNIGICNKTCDQARDTKEENWFDGTIKWTAYAACNACRAEVGTWCQEVANRNWDESEERQTRSARTRDARQYDETLSS